MIWNHVAFRVVDEAFDCAVSMFVEQLGFQELRRTERAIWLGAEDIGLDLQLSRSSEKCRSLERRFAQISFIDSKPRERLEELKEWLLLRGLEATVAAYSDKEYYLDVPSMCVDFVIECMLPEMAVYEARL